MREIEFRAWLKNRKKMRIVCAIDFSSNEVDCSGNDEYVGWYGLNEYELMQWTGLKDINGTKIFEGDIVEIWYNFENEYFEEKTLHSRGVIKFDKGMFEVKFEGYNYYINADGLTLEVIGNIYENPELLEV